MDNSTTPMLMVFEVLAEEIEEAITSFVENFPETSVVEVLQALNAVSAGFLHAEDDEDDESDESEV